MNDNAISLGDNANITLRTGSTVRNTANSGNGLYNAGPNTIEFNSYGKLTVESGATIIAGGLSNKNEPVNVIGTGNQIVNRGTITSVSGAAIWFEDRTIGQGNTIDNYGIIETQLGANSNVIGNQQASNVTFINRTGATVRGSLSFAGGDDTLTLETGSTITGSFDGGGGTNTLSLSGSGDDFLAGDIRNFQRLTKDGAGRWTLTGAVGANGGNAPLDVFVNSGTLALTGNNANFNGSVTIAAAGILEGRAQSLPPTIVDNGIVRFVQDTAGTYSGAISGSGSVEKTLGGALTLSGANSYSGGTFIRGGTVFISSDTNLGAASGPVFIDGGALGSVANVTTARTITVGPLGGGLDASTGTTLTHSGTVLGSGQLSKTGEGTVVLTGNNGYVGGTLVKEGVLQVSAPANLGAAIGLLTFDGGTLRTTADMTIARLTQITANGGTLDTAAGTTLTHSRDINGAGTLAKIGAGTLVLTGANDHGGTAINGGVVQVTSDTNLGTRSATLSFDGGTLSTNNDLTVTRPGVIGPGGGTLDTAAGSLTYTGMISGSGGLNSTGDGITILTGNNSYSGPTTVAAGYLIINGDQTAASGVTTAQSGARLSGSGIIGGDVVILDTAILAPGYQPFTPAILTINGSLTLNNASNVFYNIQNTTVGDALNDLTVVRGDLTLDGVIDVLDIGQDLGPGVYRIFDYGGALTDNGLEIGSYASAPGSPTRDLTGFSVQTAVAGQVNLINTTGLSLNFWDGTAGPKNDDAINGGDGIWRHAGPQATFNWTDPNGAVNAPWADDQFAIFQGEPGTVDVVLDNGAVTTSGMQFVVDGYLVQGGDITLVDSASSPGEAVIRVGAGAGIFSGSDITATISASMTGDVLLRKVDAGTLVLTGANSYTGGTIIDGGVVEIAGDANLGAASGGLAFDGGTLRTTTSFASGRSTTLNAGGGTFDTATGTVFSLGGAVTGPGALTHTGAGNLTLLADSSYSGGTTISAGTLQLGNGSTTGSITGSIVDDGTLVINRSNQLLLAGTISGSGRLAQAGTGTTILTGNNTYTGGTTIGAGTLQLGNGGTSGGIVGDIVDNGMLVFNRSNDLVVDGVISGSGAVIQQGSGATFLNGNNSYAGTTEVAGGLLYIDGDQSVAIGDVTVATGAQLGGVGIVGGSAAFADGAGLRPGSIPLTPGTLTFNQDLTLSNTTRVLYNILDTTVGGARNDLTIVNGNLVLDGQIDILDQSQNLGPGVYRIFNYSGTLTDNTLEVGSYIDSAGAPTRPLDGFTVQTVVPNQINLINTSGLTLNYWDGSALANKNDNIIEGGDGTWFNAGPNATSAWTDPAGSVNAPWTDGQFAIFIGAPGVVDVSNSDGPIRTSGMQFGVDGYLLQGDPITFSDPTTGNVAFIRVGDGTAAGATMTATITANLIGDATLIKQDLGTLVLSGTNTHAGGTGIFGGTLQISANENLGVATSAMAIIDGSRLRTTETFLTDRLVILGSSNLVDASAGIIETIAGTTLTISGTITEDPSRPPSLLEKDGDGTLILTAANTYSGGTLIGAGTLQLGNGGTTGSIVGDIVDNSSLVINRSNEFILAGVISGTGALEQVGSGTTIITGENTYAGGTTISNGALQIGDGGTTGHIVGDILNNSILLVDRSDTKLTPGVISGTGQLIQAGTGTLVLQADNTYTGGTTIQAGTLQLGDGGTAGSVVGDIVDNGRLVFNRSDTHTYGGAITGTGSVEQAGPGKTILTANSFYTGGTTVSAGILQFGDGTGLGGVSGDVLNNATLIGDWAAPVFYEGSVSGTGNTTLNNTSLTILTGNHTYTGGTLLNGGRVEIGFIGTVTLPFGEYTSDGTSGSFVGDVVNNTANGLAINRVDSLLITGVISGTGSFEQMGPGTTVFEANNTYTGGTLISQGTLQIGNGGETGLVPGDVVNNGRLVINRSNAKLLEGVVSGTGELVQAGLGTLIIENTNSYSGGTAVESGILQISRDDNLGAASGGLRLSNGTLRTTADMTTARTTVIAQGGGTIETVDGTTLTHNGLLDGAGSLTKTGGGLLILSGDNGYAGPTNVVAGALWIYGDQSAATGLTSVFDSATLGGIGTIGGDTTIADGGTLAPGDTPGTLTIAGGLMLDPGSILDYEFGQANVPGGSLNDLTVVGGDLILDGTINVAVSTGGTFGAGLYRILDYSGTLTDNGLAIGTIPNTSYYVQTSIAGQVNLVNTTGLTLNYWDGVAGPKNDGVVNGGDGIWQNSTGNDNWTTEAGTPNAPFTDAAFAVFQGTGGVVAIDASPGPINVSGMYFGVDSYVLSGDQINLVALPDSVVRVGDGTVAGAALTATVNAVLAGDSRLVKTDLGTLILTSANSYTGGTLIAGGVLQAGSDANLGSPTTSLALAGGTLRTTANITSARTVQLGGGGGTFETVAATTLTLNGTVTGADGLTKTGNGTLLLTADNSYTGVTTISAGTLQLGNGGTAGNIAGDIMDNGVLVVNRSNQMTLAGTISGSGSLVQAGSGTTILSGANRYTGPTSVDSGTLLVNGNQAAATGSISVAADATLGGLGIVGGSVIVDGTLAPGGAGNDPGVLTIAQDLSLASGATLAYNFGQANVVGGPLNDLTVVQGNLVLDGTIDVTAPSGGSLDPGIYRVVSYAGTLTDNGLEIGATPASGFSVQTSIASQVNLINTAGLTLNFWDGAAGPKNDGSVNGGDGLWQSSGGNDNWTTASGTPNAPFADGAFAIFQGAPGIVTANGAVGAVNTAGMQFAVDGYLIQGDPLNLTGTNATIRVGDGSAEGVAMTTTIASVLIGSSALTKSDLGTLILTGANTYSGGASINGGVLQVESDANLGAATGSLSLDGGTLRTTADLSTARATTLGANGGTFETQAALTLAGTIAGPGGLTKTGPGVMTLTAANSYAGPTNLAEGAIYVENDQSAAIGIVSVASGATLGGGGVIGGSVDVAGALAPGSAGATPGALTIAQDLSLTPTARLAYNFGQANVVAGPFNDLVVVGGDVVLDGAIDVTLSPGGVLDPGVYRVLSYSGALTDNGLAIGSIPVAGFSVQTSVASQVNLINTAGLTLDFWDGQAGPKNDRTVNGGDGVWQNATGNDNWTTTDGIPNAPFTDASFAIFQGASGTVTVDTSLGPINVSGMQFTTDGYVVEGNSIALVAPTSVIRVGDGTADGAGVTATIGSVLTGDARLSKTDLGTLVLGGANTYAGGTSVTGGTLQIASDTNLGAANGDLALDAATLRTTGNIDTARNVTVGAGGAAFDTQSGTVLTIQSPVTGGGSVSKTGSGVLILLENNTYAGPTSVEAGTLALGYPGRSSDAGILGPATVASGAELGGYGTVAGDVVNSGTISVGNALSLFADGDVGEFAIGGTLTNAGTAKLAGSTVGNRLATGSYRGQGAFIVLNSVLAGDNAPTDQLVIHGGTATGSSQLQITNAGGAGAETPGNGIQVVLAANGATTALGAFVLTDRLVAGPYQYLLFRGGRDGSDAESWFLRTEAEGTETPSVDPDDPEPPPLYRPEVPTYTATPSMALMYGRSLIGTLHQRVGDLVLLEGDATEGEATRVWGRILGQRNDWDAEPGGVYNEGPTFDADFYALQAGVDLFRRESDDGGLTVAGVYGAYGRSEGDVADFDLSEAGRVEFNAYTIGMYATHYAAHNWYVDAVAQLTRYEERAGSGFFEDMRTKGTGVAASIEAGVPVELGQGFKLEPQAQIIYQMIDFDDSSDPAAQVRFNNVDALSGRLGLRLVNESEWSTGQDVRPIVSWLRVNLWREFIAEPETSFSTEDGFLPFRSDMRGSWVEFGAGASMQMTRSAGIFLNGAYQTSFGKEASGWDLRAGVRFGF